MRIGIYNCKNNCNYRYNNLNNIHNIPFYSFFSLRSQQYCTFRLTAFMCRTAVCYARLLVRKGANKAETKVVAAVAGAVPVAHLAAVGTAAPAAATEIAAANPF